MPPTSSMAIVARASSSGNGKPYLSTVATNFSTPPSIFLKPWYASIGPITTRMASSAAPLGSAPPANGNRIGPKCMATPFVASPNTSRLGSLPQLPCPAVLLGNPLVRLGCRIVRVHDVAGTVRVVRMVERILEAEAAEGLLTGAGA
jgi:hypothetical protein